MERMKRKVKTSLKKHYYMRGKEVVEIMKERNVKLKQTQREEVSLNRWRVKKRDREMKRYERKEIGRENK
jgi:hypothetical protein